MRDAVLSSSVKFDTCVPVFIPIVSVLFVVYIRQLKTDSCYHMAPHGFYLLILVVSALEVSLSPLPTCIFLVFYRIFTEKEIVEVYNEDDGIYKKMVMKTGRTTGQTFGQLDGEIESIRMEHPAGSNRYYIFKNIYLVYNISGQGHFFEPEDSGSGVFVAEGKKPGKALGIGFATSVHNSKTFVCKIAKVLNTLKLKIVRQNY